MSEHLSTQQIADLLGVDVWRIQRLFELGVLPEPPRFAGRRVIAGQSLPQIVDALRSRNWLPDSQQVSAVNKSDFPAGALLAPLNPFRDETMTTTTPAQALENFTHKMQLAQEWATPEQLITLSNFYADVERCAENIGLTQLVMTIAESATMRPGEDKDSFRDRIAELQRRTCAAWS